MSPKDTFVSLLQQQPVRAGDVIFLLQGDGLFRAPHAVDLFRQGLAPRVALVGSADDRSYGSYPSREVRSKMLELGLPDAALYFEEVAPHTRAEAERAMQLAQQEGWKALLIVTSPHHQWRAYLTFVKAMHDASLTLRLINAPAPLSMDEVLPWGTRRSRLPQEFDRIELYQQKGDVASYEEGIAYLSVL